MKNDPAMIRRWAEVPDNLEERKMINHKPIQRPPAAVSPDVPPDDAVSRDCESSAAVTHCRECLSPKWCSQISECRRKDDPPEPVRTDMDVVETVGFLNQLALHGLIAMDENKRQDCRRRLKGIRQVSARLQAKLESEKNAG